MLLYNEADITIWHSPLNLL